MEKEFLLVITVFVASKNIFQFDLDTAWDISTLDFSSEVTASINGHGQNPNAIHKV